MNRLILALALLCAASSSWADSVTPRMGLVKPDVGSVGWGPKVNSNYDTLDTTAAALGSPNAFTAQQTITVPLGSNALLIPSGNVGLGTLTPSTQFEIVSASVAPAMVTRYANDALGASWIGRKARGTESVPLALLAGDRIVLYGGRGFDGSVFSSTTTGAIALAAEENFSPTAHGTQLQFFTTPLGGNDRILRAVITANGNVGISTPTPTAALDVGAGSIVAGGSVTAANLVGNVPASEISGVLPVAHGGTGFSLPLASTGTYTPSGTFATASTAWITVPGSTVTATMTGHRVVVTYWCPQTNSAANNCEDIGLLVNGAYVDGESNTLGFNRRCAGAGVSFADGTGPLGFNHPTIGTYTGSTSFAVIVKVTAGTGTLGNAATLCQLAVSEIYP